MSTSAEPSGTPRPESPQGGRSATASSPGFAEVLTLAESLDTQDQTRLVARMLETLPPNSQAAIVAFALENLRLPTKQVIPRTNAPPDDSIGPTVWERLFDPTKTSELYSAPRRFDLATIFVVTAAYSILFGAMTAMDFGPVTKMVVGMLVTIVAVSQAFFHNVANPRGVSIVTGAIAQSILLVMLRMFVRNSIQEPFLVVVIFYGLIGGVISGYLCGVMVGGVFLVADMLRAKFEGRSKAKSGDAPEDVD